MRLGAVLLCGLRFPVVPGSCRVFTEHSRNGLLPVLAWLPAVYVVVSEGVFDPGVPHLLVAVDAAGVDAEQDVHAVSGAAGYLRGWDPCVES